MSIFPKSLVPDDFVIIVRPVKDDEELNINGGHWTGEVQVSIVTNAKETTLTEDEFNNMIMLCNFAAASIPAMEENEFVRDIIENYVSKNMVVPIPEDENLSELVLTLDSATKGSA